MTYEKFKQLAEHPQHRDVPAIFKLEVLETEELEEKKRLHYPKYKVNTYCPQAFTTTLEKERMMGQMGGAPQMPGMGAAVPQVQYYIGINEDTAPQMPGMPPTMPGM